MTIAELYIASRDIERKNRDWDNDGGGWKRRMEMARYIAGHSVNQR